MTGLTVGYVSGMIAAAVYLFQFIIPNAIILVLVGIVKDKHTAVTWSHVQRSLASSTWPTILRTEATTKRKLDTRVRLVGWLRALAALLIAVAAVVTPLGLSDTVAPSKQLQMLQFSYVKDTGPMGYGTPPRSNLGFTRSCGDFYPVPCPGTSVDIVYVGNSTELNVTIVNDDYDMRIPKELATLYQSGLEHQEATMSSWFDIQWRQYSYSVEAGVDHGDRYIVDSFRQLDSMILNDAVEPVEGLIVDTRKGAIGFRNHTVPTGVQYGAEWQEDILFIQPETACVNMNVSFEFRLPYREIGEVADLSLVDHGGFANINTTYPRLDLSGAQQNPQLRNRAHKAAWLTNAYNMLFLNVTRPSPHSFSYLNSKVGQKWPLSISGALASYRALTVTNLYSYILNPDQYNFTFEGDTKPKYANPFNITNDNYTDISVLCEGVGGMDLANMNNIKVACGLVLGAATRKDGSHSLIFEPNTWWTQPVYSCASTNKAIIKTVHFKWNATVGEGLKGLQILDATDKVYKNNSDKPLWGVETLDMALHEVTQFWGLISGDRQQSVNLTTIRGDHLYLPGYELSSFSGLSGFQYMPGTSGPARALTTVYSPPLVIGISADYSGQTDLAIFSRWQRLSRNETTTEKIVNLMWTDLAANALVGTKSWSSGKNLPPNLSKRDATGSSTSPLIPAQVYTHQIRYDWTFAIPALILGLLSIIVLAVSVGFMIFGHASPARVNHLLKHLSPGRLLVTHLYPGECDGLAPKRVWVPTVGGKEIRLDRDKHVVYPGTPLNTDTSATDSKMDGKLGVKPDSSLDAKPDSKMDVAPP